MIKERVMQVLETQNIPKERFFKRIGMSSANFRGKAKESPLNSNTIKNIITEIPNLNIDWLITGNGSMFLDKKEDNEYKDKYFQCLEEQNKLLHELNNLKNIHDSDQSIEAPKLKSKN